MPPNPKVFGWCPNPGLVFAHFALLYFRIVVSHDDFGGLEQEDRGVREAGGTDLSPIFLFKAPPGNE